MPCGVLEMLRAAEIETHLVVSKAGHLTRSYETELSRGDLEALADFVYSPANIGAAIASGSFRTAGMIVAPCSTRTLAEIASGVTSSLLSLRGRRLPEAAAAAGVAGARNTPARRPPEKHARRDRDGGDHHAAGAGLLYQADDHR